MNACAITYRIFRELTTAAVDLYKRAAVAWRGCSESPCWFLCLNRFFCYVLLIIVFILVTVLLVFWVLVSVALVTTCWATCVIAFFFTFGGNKGKANINCFADDPMPSTPAPEPLPTVMITKPAAGTPAGYYLPTEAITFTAIGEDVDGSPLTGASLQWFDTFPGATDQPLGEGETISIMLVLRPEDAQAGRVTEHLVSVVATGAGGQRSRPSLRSANIRQGLG
jgi:hypothetical protein